MEFDLYFVGLEKHGRVQHLETGPFVDWSGASDSATALTAAHPNGYPYVVVKTSLPFEAA